MTRIGADADEMLALSRQMRQSAKQVDRVRETLHRLLRTAEWSGSDAESFSTAWSALRVELESAAVALMTAATTVSRNAQEQVEASSLGSTGVGEHLPAAETELQSRPHERTEPLSMSDVLSGEHLPSTVHTRTINGGISVGPITASAIKSAQLEDFDGPFSVVSITTDAGLAASLAAGGGPSVDLGDSEWSAAATAHANLGITGRDQDSWVVPDSDAREFLNQRIIDESTRTAVQGLSSAIPSGRGSTALQNLPIVGTGLGLVESAGDWIVEQVRDLPEPDRTTRSTLGVMVTMGAMAGTGPLFGDLTGTVRAQASTVERHGRETAHTFQVDGEAAGAVTTGLLSAVGLPDSFTEGFRSTITVTEPVNGMRTLIVDQLSRSGVAKQRSAASFMVEDEEFGEVLDRAWTHLKTGDVPQAAQELEGIEAELKHMDRGIGVATDDDWGGRLTVDAGVPVGIKGTFTDEKVEYR